MPVKPPAVGEIIKALSGLDPNMPVIVSTHYDNDIGYGSMVDVRQRWMEPVEDSYWGEYDPVDLRSLGEPLPAHGVRALVITASG